MPEEKEIEKEDIKEEDTSYLPQSMDKFRSFVTWTLVIAISFKSFHYCCN